MEAPPVDTSRNTSPLGPERLGRFIERCRLARGLRQGELATRAGVNASYLSSIEAGQRKWPNTIMPKIARALGVHEAFFAYEAGVITEDPASLVGSVPFPPDDPRARVVDAMAAMDPTYASAVLALVETLPKGGAGDGILPTKEGARTRRDTLANSSVTQPATSTSTSRPRGAGTGSPDRRDPDAGR